MTTTTAMNEPRHQSSLRYTSTEGRSAEALINAIDELINPAPATREIVFDSASTASTTEYCRKARRLRARLSKNPGKLHRELAELNGPLHWCEPAATANAQATEAAFKAANTAGSEPASSSAPGVSATINASNVCTALAVRVVARTHDQGDVDPQPVPRQRISTWTNTTRMGRNGMYNVSTPPPIEESPSPAPAVISIPKAEPPEHFAKLVEAALENGMLRYPRRMALLREAALRGIGRFEANLMIAAIQHKANAANHPPVMPPPQPRRTVAQRIRNIIAALASFALIQGLILLGTWLALR